MTLPTEASARKAVPIATGVLDCFPDAIAEVANCSYVGSQQHNPGQPTRWDRAKSTDEADALMRHFMERGTVDSDGVRHSAKVAWRALALLQKELEAERGVGNVISINKMAPLTRASEGSFERDAVELTRPVRYRC